MAVCPIWHTQSVNGWSSPKRSRPFSRSRMRAVLSAASGHGREHRSVSRCGPDPGGHVHLDRPERPARARQVEGDGRSVLAGGPQEATPRTGQREAEHLAAVSLQGARVGQRRGVVDVHDLLPRDRHLAAPGEERRVHDLPVDALGPADRPPPRVTELEVRRAPAVRRDPGRHDPAAGFVDAHDQSGQQPLASGAQVEHPGPLLPVGLGGDPAVPEAPALPHVAARTAPPAAPRRSRDRSRRRATQWSARRCARAGEPTRPPRGPPPARRRSGPRR